MRKLSQSNGFLIAGLLALTPAAAFGQATTTNTADANMSAMTDNSAMTNTDSMDTMGSNVAGSGTTGMTNDMGMAQTTQESREDHDFPWGLLGLLGLAGLLGLKRRDDDVVRVDDRSGTTTDNRL